MQESLPDLPPAQKQQQLLQQQHVFQAEQQFCPHHIDNVTFPHSRQIRREETLPVVFYTLHC